MIVEADQQRLKQLLSDAIPLLCKNGLGVTSKFSIEALIGITLEKNEVFLVSFKETVTADGAKFSHVWTERDKVISSAISSASAHNSPDEEFRNDDVTSVQENSGFEDDGEEGDGEDDPAGTSIEASSNQLEGGIGSDRNQIWSALVKRDTDVANSVFANETDLSLETGQISGEFRLVPSSQHHQPQRKRQRTVPSHTATSADVKTEYDVKFDGEDNTAAIKIEDDDDDDGTARDWENWNETFGNPQGLNNTPQQQGRSLGMVRASPSSAMAGYRQHPQYQSHLTHSQLAPVRKQHAGYWSGSARPSPARFTQQSMRGTPTKRASSLIKRSLSLTPKKAQPLPDIPSMQAGQSQMVPYDLSVGIPHLIDLSHTVELIPPTPGRAAPKKRCRVCYSMKLRKEVRYQCRDCSDHPGLCLDKCFRIFHKAYITSSGNAHQGGLREYDDGSSTEHRGQVDSRETTRLSHL